MDSKTKNVTFGDQVEIICTTPLQHGVEWEFAGNGSMTICTGITVHHAGDKYECKGETHRHTLIIKDVNFDDAGVYTCIDKEGRAMTRDSMRLRVIGSCK